MNPWNYKQKDLQLENESLKLKIKELVNRIKELEQELSGSYKNIKSSPYKRRYL